MCDSDAAPLHLRQGPLLRLNELPQTAPARGIFNFASAVVRLDFGPNTDLRRGPPSLLDFLVDHPFRHAEAITEWNRVLRLLEPNPHPDLVFPELRSISVVIHDRTIRRLTEPVLAPGHGAAGLRLQQSLHGDPFDRLAFPATLLTQETIPWIRA